MKKTLLLILPFLFLAQCGPEVQYTDFRRDIEAFIRRAMEKMSAKYGLAITVVKDDHMIYEGCFGPADAENNIPVTPETDFYIASSTKSFTALATLILAKQEKLDLNRTLASYFPEISFAPELKADSITVYHLLTHTAGLENDPLVFTTAYTGNHTPEKLLRILADFTRVDEQHPFHQFAYTNFGYVVISMILEREVKKPWQDILAETVFKPLGMNQTSAYISDAKRYGWPLALPYTQVNKEKRLERIPLVKKDNTMHAAGGMITTIENLSRWLVVQLNQGQIDGRQVFPAGLISRAQTAQVSQDRKYFNMHRFAYGYGWNLASTITGDTLIHHFGGYPGAHAQVSFMPRYKTGIAVLANENSQGQDLAWLAASYAFDYLAGRQGMDSVYAAALDSTREQNDRWLERVFAHQADRSRRIWQLKLPFAAYIGRYFNDPMGELIVTNPSDSVLMAELGNLKSEAAEPYTQPNSIRVEMIPGSGSVLHFQVEEGRVTGAELEGMEFRRVP